MSKTYPWDRDFGVSDNQPHGWIQWKGTSVCMDVHCKCGYHGHVDLDFFYYFECPVCKAKYAVGCNVKLIELTGEEVANAGDFQTDEDYVEEKRTEKLVDDFIEGK